MTTPLAWKLRALLCAIALVAYADSLGLGLATDARLIVRDPRVQSVSAEHLSLIVTNDYWWPSSVGQVYRPVTTASFLFNYAILGNGESAAGYHWVNVILHIGNVWLVFELALLLLTGPWPAFFAAALWAVHPIGTEAVANVAGRADLLSAMAVLGALLLYVRGARAAWLFIAAALGVFAKENAAALVGLMLLWDVSFGTGGWRRRIPSYVAAACALVLLFWMRRQVFAAAPWPELPFVDNPLQAAGFWTARWTAIKVIGMYLWLLVCPLSLSSDRSYNQIPPAALSDVTAWISLAAIAAILAIAIVRYRKDRLMFWCVGFFAIALLPTANLVMLIGSDMAERFLYLPSVAFAIAVVALAQRSLRPRAANIALACVILLFGIRTVARNLAWRDDLTLSSADVQTAPGSYRVHDNLATSLMHSDPLRNLDRAIQEAETAWAILSPLPPAEIFQQTPANLGMYYRIKGDVTGGTAAHAWYEKSLAVLLRAQEVSRAHERDYDRQQLAHGKPLATRVAFQPLYLYLGTTYARLQRYSEAIEAYRYARVLNPATPDSYDEIARVSLAAGDPGSAAIALDQKAATLGLAAPTITALADVYSRIPGGACAIAQGKLDLGCPRLHSDMCLAWADLTHVFIDARLPSTADDFKNTAIRTYGCAAAPFDAPH